MGLCGWLTLGGLAGWIASRVLGAKARMGIFSHILVGIVGAFMGGVVMHFFGGQGVTGFNLYSFGVTLLGAILTLVIARLIVGR